MFVMMTNELETDVSIEERLYESAKDNLEDKRTGSAQD